MNRLREVVVEELKALRKICDKVKKLDCSEALMVYCEEHGIMERNHPSKDCGECGPCLAKKR